VNNLGEFVYTPEDLGFEKIEQHELWGGETVADAAQIFINVLDNNATDAQRNAVVINSAFTIQTRCPQKPLEQCKDEARESLESGQAKKTFVKFEEIYG
jgi:anthranilate phosphoribosyltransferase